MTSSKVASRWSSRGPCRMSRPRPERPSRRTAAVKWPEPLKSSTTTRLRQRDPRCTASLKRRL
eukprot:2822224-Pyramimonas_sp.AAC.1